MAKKDDFLLETETTYRVGDISFYLEFDKRDGYELVLRTFGVETEYNLFKIFPKEQGGRRVLARFTTSPRPGKRQDREFDELIRVLKRERIDYKIINS